MTLQDDTSVDANTAAREGGGIFNLSGEVTLQAGSRVAGNAAVFGRGISNNGGTLTLQAGSLVGGDTAADANTATDGGGGIDNSAGIGTVTVETDAFVCDNSDPQCIGVLDNCPNPESGVCSG